MSQFAKVGKRTPVISSITVSRTQFQSRDIGNWRDAVNQARDVINPRRKLLQELYEDIVLDGHLASVMGKRSMGITNKRVEFVVGGAEKGKVSEAMDEHVLHTPWFHDLLAGAMSAVPYGATVLELIPEGGELARVEVVPRINVVPERHIILENAYTLAVGWDYLNDPVYKDYLVPVGKPKDYGLLMVAAQYVIYKRFGFAGWAQYLELFGMPYRVGHYDPHDAHTRDLLDKALREMSGSGHIVIPEGAAVEFMAATGSAANSGDAYDMMLERCNAELSKLFLGQTLTTEQGQNGARSLGEVHKETEDAITLSDMRRIEFLLNWEVQERLLKFGYPAKDGLFRFPDTTELSLEARLNIDMQVSTKVEIPEEYWYKTYGIPKPDGNARPAKVDGPDDDPDDDDPDDGPEEPGKGTGEKKKPAAVARAEGFTASLTAGLDAYYGLPSLTAAAPKGGGMPKHILHRLEQALRNGQITQDSVDPELMQWIALEFTKYLLRDGEVGNDSGLPHITPEEHRQIQVFSGFKTNAELRKANDALYDAHGRMVPFSEFKRRIKAMDQAYNVRYLKAEYNLADANRRSIDRWKDFQATKHVRPFAQYHTVGDDRVREAHAAMDGVIKHIDDPFWDIWWPPNGWNCRCTVLSASSDKGGKPVPANVVPPKTMFANNVGKNGVLFPVGHPYAEQADLAVRERVEQLAEEAVRSGNTLLLLGLHLAWARSRKFLKELGAELALDFTSRVLPKLPAATKAAINRYTGVEHEIWNNALRKGLELPAEVEDIRAALATFLTVKAMVVFRGVDEPHGTAWLAQLHRLGVGGQFTMDGFTSTSLNPRERRVLQGKVSLRIHVPKGSRALYISPISGAAREMELLLDHGTTYRILGFSTEGGRHFIDLIVVNTP